MQASKQVDFSRGKSEAIRKPARSPRAERELLRRRRLTFLAGWTGGIACALVTLWLFRHGGTLCGALGMLSAQLGGASIILGFWCSDLEGSK
jgi:hypothetical protein